MNEHEMLEEIARLRCELEAANKSRERLREIICAILPLDSPEFTEMQVQEMMHQPKRGIEDIIAELLRDDQGALEIAAF